MADLSLRIDTLNHPSLILHQPLTVQLAESGGQVAVGLSQLDLIATAATRTEAITQFCDLVTAAYEAGDARVVSYLNRYLRPANLAPDTPPSGSPTPSNSVTPNSGTPVFVLIKDGEVKGVIRDSSWAERWVTWAGGTAQKHDLDKLP